MKPATRETLTLVIVGHVDHGKSTLVGRLLHDVGSLPLGKVEAIRQMCEKRGMPFEWSFVMDALQVERDQGITVDTSQIWFSTGKRRYAIIDAPGHKEFLKNMISGSSRAEAALLVVDAREGVREQSRRHAFLLHLLGIRQVAVLVNKMDAVAYDEKSFRTVEEELGKYLAELGVEPFAFIPVSSREGDGLAKLSEKMAWYEGPTVVGALDAFTAHPSLEHLPLRLSVQDVYKFDDRRIIVGRVDSGSFKVGDTVLFSPSGMSAQIAGIEAWPAESAPKQATAGQSVGFTLSEQIFVERGHVMSHAKQAPMLTNAFRARIFWLGKEPLELQRRYKLRIGAAEVSAELRKIEHAIQADTLVREPAESVERHMVAEVIFRVRGFVAADSFAENPCAGRFVIQQGYDIAGGGIIDLTGFVDQRVVPVASKSQNLTPVANVISLHERARVNGHMGGILWFTGLSGSGKSTLAQALQKKLFARGYHVFVLDGDNVRHGLCRDLGFSPEDRRENLRRAGEVAALMAQSGCIVITSFISPTHEDRATARAAAPEFFHTVYIRADLATCEQRDVKGLYKKARSGEIKEFTGISAPYEEPANPDMVVDTMQNDVHGCVDMLAAYVERQFVEPVRNLPPEIAANEI